MPTPLRLSRGDARRVAVRAQLLRADRPTDLLDMVRHLAMLQLDPISAVAPAADTVAWTRLGAEYAPDQLRAAVERRDLIELRAVLRPAEHLALHRAEMAEWPGTGELRPYQHELRDWVAANDACRRDIIERLRADGPLPSRVLPDTCVRPWASTGWTGGKNVTKLLDLMVQRGEVAVAGRKGRDRLWDLAERVYPDHPVVPTDEAVRRRDALRLRALGIARSYVSEAAVEQHGVGEAGVPAVVDDVPGAWRLDPSYLDQPFEGRAALLSPFDRLVADRRRLADLFEFEYFLEMYKPVAKRRWGYYALPILHGDRLVGKLDATADRKAGVLRVAAVHEDEPFSSRVRADVQDEIEGLAAWLALDLVLP